MKIIVEKDGHVHIKESNKKDLQIYTCDEITDWDGGFGYEKEVGKITYARPFMDTDKIIDKIKEKFKRLHPSYNPK